MAMFYNFQASIMQTLTSAKVQANFGQTIDMAKAGEPITITQYGRPTVMLFSYKEGAELIRLRDAARLSHYFEERQALVAQDAPALSMDNVNTLLHELRD